MSRISLFDSPLFLGFDHFERLVDQLSKSSNEGYPPYNIEQLGDHGFRITLAVAGFSPENLDVSMEDNQLTVKGRQDDDVERVYLHRGIATRQFQRSFVLAEGIEVSSADFHNGLLHINLIRPKITSQVKKIDIKSSSLTDTAMKAIPAKINEHFIK
ncbi:MAG: Hsp20 family protein [Holosporales bacterium]|jgi:HSP20 family molecular chaperone IbpA|nr:Hsp20 family protein [Holosporales bacterium]